MGVFLPGRIGEKQTDHTRGAEEPLDVLGVEPGERE